MMLLVSKSTTLQLRAIYSVQVFCYNNNFPKGNNTVEYQLLNLNVASRTRAIFIACVCSLWFICII